MNFEEFQQLARLYIVGALDPDELADFRAGRREFGAEAERFIDECRKLNAVFALSLHPCEPDPRTKGRLFAQIREASAPKGDGQRADRPRPRRSELIMGQLAPGRN